MSINFELNLETHNFRIGEIVKGKLQDLYANISLTSKQGASSYKGSIEGSFIGEVKNQITIPLTLPHVPCNKDKIIIIIVGAGGTGSYVIRDFARYIHALKQKGDTREFVIRIVDADIVEEKNILRQNFIPKDLGLNKAEVQAKRYANAFGIEIESIPEMLTSNNIDRIIESSADALSIIVGCVDNHEARRTISQYMTLSRISGGNTRHCRYWIDSGNEKKSGQVVCGYSKNLSYFQNNNLLSFTDFSLPTVTKLYPDILDESKDEIEGTISCAERGMEDTQNIFVNMMAAGYVLSYLRQIISKEKITINAIHFNIKGLTTVSYLTKEYLQKY